MADSPTLRRDRRSLLHPAVAALCLVALTVVVFIPAMKGGFVWDDDLLVTDNQMIRSAGGLHDFWLTTKPMDYFPLTSTTFWLEWRLWGLNPKGYHVVNVILHALAAVVVWRILLHLGLPGAYLAAAVFAVHPVTAASVTWIAERKNVLSMLLCALSVLALLRFEESRRRRLYAAALIVFLFALLAKTAVVAMPVGVLILAWWRRGRVSRLDVVRMIPFLLLSLAMGLVTIYYQHHGAMGEGGARQTDLLSRLAGSGWCVWFYLYKALVPVNLSMVYPLWHIDPQRFLSWMPLLGLIAAAALGWRYRRTWGRPLLAALGLYVAMLMPVLGFVNMAFHRLSLVADHLQYVALIAPIALVVGGVTVLLRRVSIGRWASRALAVTILVILSVLTWQKAGVYSNQLSLWQDTLKRNPNAWIGHVHLGLALRADNKIAEAIQHFREALRLKPDHVGARINLGDALGAEGKIAEAIDVLEEALNLDPAQPKAHTSLAMMLESQDRRAEAIEHYETALKIAPDLAEAHVNLGNALSATGRPDEAAAHYRTAIGLKPEIGDAYFNLGLALSSQGKLDEAADAYLQALARKPDDAGVLYRLGVVRARQGDTEDATRQFMHALAVAPRHASAHYDLAVLLQGQGNLAEAITHYRQAVETAPNSAQFMHGLGAALSDAGSYQEGITRLRQALDLEPDAPAFINTLAWVLATASDPSVRRPKEAVRLAERARELAGEKVPEFLDTLAAAYAAAGQYGKAVKTAEAAVALATTRQADRLADDIRGRLELYRQSRPYVEHLP